jgi:hypothetical protein
VIILTLGGGGGERPLSIYLLIICLIMFFCLFCLGQNNFLTTYLNL